MGGLLKWIAGAIRDWLNGYLDPEWKQKQADLGLAVKSQVEQHAETVKENAAIDARVEQRDAEIAADEKLATESEARRVTESERIEKADDLKDLWFPKE